MYLSHDLKIQDKTHNASRNCNMRNVCFSVTLGPTSSGSYFVPQAAQPLLLTRVITKSIARKACSTWSLLRSDWLCSQHMRRFVPHMQHLQHKWLACNSSQRFFLKPMSIIWIDLSNQVETLGVIEGEVAPTGSGSATPGVHYFEECGEDGNCIMCRPSVLHEDNV